MDRLLTIAEVCDRLGVGKTTLWRYARKPDFPPRVRLSRRKVGFLQADIEKWLKSKEECKDE